jgi:ubiquinone/menaquinone biosynthesis C-methylase UbiE
LVFCRWECDALLLGRLLRIAFNLLYNQLAWTYDLVSWTVSAGQWPTWQRSTLRFLPGRPVLEVAHGTGNLLLDLVSLGLQPIGLDLSPSMSRIASSKLKRRLDSQELPVPLVRGSAEALPFAANSLSTVVSTFPTEFIVQANVIAEFHRVLRPGRSDHRACHRRSLGSLAVQGDRSERDRLVRSAFRPLVGRRLPRSPRAGEPAAQQSYGHHC